MDADTDESGQTENKPAKTSLMALVVGRGNQDSDTDFCEAAIDDVSLWQADLSNDTSVAQILQGKDCGGEDSLGKFHTNLLSPEQCVQRDHLYIKFQLLRPICLWRLNLQRLKCYWPHCDH